jgi:hypothetical protein
MLMSSTVSGFKIIYGMLNVFMVFSGLIVNIIFLKVQKRKLEQKSI